jgi:hypothetical protein
MKQPLGFPQTYIISTKYKIKKNRNNPWVFHKHISFQQNTKDNNPWVFHKHISSQ